MMNGVHVLSPPKHMDKALKGCKKSTMDQWWPKLTPTPDLKKFCKFYDKLLLNANIINKEPDKRLIQPNLPKRLKQFSGGKNQEKSQKLLFQGHGRWKKRPSSQFLVRCSAPCLRFPLTVRVRRRIGPTFRESAIGNQCT